MDIRRRRRRFFRGKCFYNVVCFYNQGVSFQTICRFAEKFGSVNPKLELVRPYCAERLQEIWSPDLVTRNRKRHTLTIGVPSAKQLPVEVDVR